MGDDNGDAKSKPSVHVSSGRSECSTLLELGKVNSDITENAIPSKRRKDMKGKSKSNGSSSASTVKRSVAGDSDEANPWMKKTSTKSTSTIPGSKVGRKAVIDVKGATEILDAKKEGEESTITSLTQEQLVRRAFVGRNESQIEEEFKKEKEAVVLENDPTRKVDKHNSVSDEVVGWGSWTGQGAPPPKPRKLPKKLQAPRKKKEEKRKRPDDYKPDVIINQKRLKKTANNFMLADVPHPYASRAEYEQAMLGGVGREWNVSSSFKSMTRPEILTRSGKIIQPISKKAKPPRPAAKF